MKKNKIKIIYSSHLSDEYNKNFERDISETIGVDHSIHLYSNFGELSLNEVYNKGLHEHKSEDSILVFMHNDIYFNTQNWGKKLLFHFNRPNNDFQILGVAGSKNIPSHSCWWLTEDQTEMNFKNMFGIVNHDNGIRKWESRYSDTSNFPIPVVMIDGLFMAVDATDLEKDFNEDFDGFHFYDLAFCIENYLDGCNIGVITDIRLTHKSIGQTNDQWEQNRIQFVETYKKYLPITVEDI